MKQKTSLKTLTEKGLTIKCDICDYKKHLRKVNLKRIKELIGCQCPKCNTMMISENDYRMYKSTIVIIRTFNIILFPLKIFSIIFTKITGKKETQKEIRFNTLTGEKK